MKQLPPDVLKAWEDREGPVIFTTTNTKNEPNSIYATCVGVFQGNQLLVADNYFQKTRENILAGSHGAILFRDKSGKAYQAKGPVEYHRDGPVFDDMKTWNPAQHPGHAAAALCVEEVYSGAEQLL